MRENLTAPLSVGAIAIASGLSERSLRRQFRRFTGQAPVAFHRGLRLEAAREALRAATSQTGVTATAAVHGFSHFGHFAARYRQRFGELPSDTRRVIPESVLSPRTHILIERICVGVHPFSVDGREPSMVALAGAATDGMIFALSRMRWLDVVDLMSVTAGPFPSLPHPVRYGVRGHVRRLGSRTQVTIRLFEAATGRHIWGNAFDGASEGAAVFLQRVIAEAAGALPIRLRDAEATHADRMRDVDRSALNLTMRALRAASALTADLNARALDDLGRARILDPNSALAVALSAWCHAQRAIYNFARVPGPEHDEARRQVAHALSLDDEEPLTLAVLSNAATMIGDLDQAELLIGKCLAIDPYCAMAWQRRGWLAAYRGRYTELSDFDHSLTLGGGNLERHNTLLGISSMHFGAGRYDQAADWAMRGIRERPSALWAYRVAAVAQALCGRKDEARRSTLLLRRQYPDLTVSTIVSGMPMQAEFLTRFADGMEAAGLPV
jgi:AraC-like DNA-binding protein/tetratricopeptide (TPR) repeat protein